jgi:hypothetical protein
MKYLKYILAVLTMAGLAANADVVNIGDATDGGNDASAIASWDSNNTVYDGSNIGMALNWEGVTINTASAGATAFTTTWAAGPGLTIGHGYLMTETFDLSTTTGGIEGMTIDLDMNASGFPNWIPMISVDGALYRYANNGNDFKNNGALSITQLTNHANTSWAQINATAGNIDDTRGASDPDLQATSGIVQFGFIQWASQSSGTIASSSYTTGIDSFNYGVTYTPIPEPSALALLGLGGLALGLRRRRAR